MNIRAVWRDPDYTYNKYENVVIISTEWLDGRLQALVIDRNGTLKYIHVKDLTVTDKKYLP